jgi:nitrite reductase/ring-hydroxylating ferredoxin subunit
MLSYNYDYHSMSEARRMSEYVKVAQQSALQSNVLKPVRLDNLLIALAEVDGNVLAFEDLCTHGYCTLSPGQVDGDTIYCPCHGGLFNVLTGAVLDGPPGRALTIYETRIEGDDIYLKLPSPTGPAPAR